MLIEFKGMVPDVSKAAFVAPTAVISGDVIMGVDSSIWFNAVIRGEVDSIRIGNRSNIQDNTMLHSDYDCPITIGEGVSIGHNSIIHGATVEDDVIVGMHATVLNGSVIGRGSLIAAGALVKEGTVVPERSLVVGVPGKVVRTFTEEEVSRQKNNAQVYVEDAREYAKSRIIEG